MDLRNIVVRQVGEIVEKLPFKSSKKYDYDYEELLRKQVNSSYIQKEETIYFLMWRRELRVGSVVSTKHKLLTRRRRKKKQEEEAGSLCVGNVVQKSVYTTKRKPGAQTKGRQYL